MVSAGMSHVPFAVSLHFVRSLLVLSLLLLVVSCSSSKSPAESKETPKPVAVETPTPVVTKKVVEPLKLAELPSDGSASLGTDKKVIKGKLDNGLVYYILPNNKPEKRAEFWISIDAGSFQEDEDQRGLAHFVEHMAFNGTKSFPKNELISKLQSMGVEFGAHLNASTSFDETIYKLRLPTDDSTSIDLGLQILSEWASAVAFQESDIEAERGVVLAEKRSGEGAEMRMMESVIESVFAETRYAERMPIGLPSVLKKASVATIKRFYQDWYHPGNMVVYVVGDIDGAEIEAKIKKQFAPLVAPKKAKSAPPRDMPKNGDLKFLSVEDAELPIQAVAVGRLAAAYRVNTIDDFRKVYSEMVMATMLSNRLKEAQQQKGARYLMAAGVPTPLVRSSRVLVFAAMVNPKAVSGGLEDLLTEIERARRHGFVKSEFERTIAQIEVNSRSAVMENEAGNELSQDLVAELTRHHLSGEGMPGRLVEYSLMKHFAKELTLDELHAPLKDFLAPEGLIVASIGSGSETEEALTKESTIAMLKKVASSQIVPYADERSDTPLLSDLPPPGTIKKTSSDADTGTTEWVLSNGATILFKSTDFRSDEVLFRASSPGGKSLLANDKLAAIRRTTEVIAGSGLSSFDSIALSKALAGRNLRLDSYIYEHEEGLQGRSGVSDLETLLQLTHLHFTAARKDDKAFALFQEEERQTAKLALNKPETRFAHKLTAFLEAGNPRLPPYDLKAVEALDQASSLAFYQDRIKNPGDFRFYFVGNVDEATLKPLVLKYLGSLPDDGRREEFKLHTWPAQTKARDLVVKDGNEKRATLLFNYRQTVDAKLATPKMRIAWRMVAATMQMRFLEVFREEMSATYGVGIRASWNQRWTEAELVVSFQCDSARATELRKAALAEVARLTTEGVSQDLFDKAKAAQIKRIETALKDNEYWLRRMSFLQFNKRPLSDITKHKAIIESVTLADLKAAQAALLTVDTVASAVLLPKR